MSDIGGDTFVVVNPGSVPVPLPYAAELVGVFVNLGTAGSTNTTVQVNKNGASLGANGLVTIAGGAATKGNKVITNPNVGVNTGNLPSGWTDQNASSLGAFNSSSGPTATPPLGTFAAGDTFSVTTTLGTSAANPGVTLVFAQV
ncbi:hypothetical protein [Streptomyces sp. NPDC058252]|uniref:hypothetical protein n=1 Tax=Streptomyces sp. NPDC058252 TaxID=3346405 RepID=UPI0036E569FB